jgi:uncharacterized protein (DUF924 family)
VTETKSGASAEDQVDALLGFWFEGLPGDSVRLRALMKKWFAGSPEQDRDFCERFGELAEAARIGKLDAWAESPRGRLALILLLDQLPRNLHRGHADAFAADPKALELCLSGIDENIDTSLKPLERIFFYMPLQHSESREIQALSIDTFGRLANENHGESLAPLLRNAADYAIEHREIVERFGRFPHRNAALERESTAEEVEFLAAGGSSFGQ